MDFHGIAVHLPFCLIHRMMTAEEKYLLVRSIGEECIQEEELRNLLEKKPNPICYDGFEPSGRMHIAQVLCLIMEFVYL